MLGLKNRMRELVHGERGAALTAVVGLMAVGVVLTAVVASSVITATGITTSVRAGVQSQAAAEAGIAAARLGLVEGTCSARAHQYVNPVGSEPEYVATVWVPSGAGWVRGCPPNTGVRVRILSTGYADAPEVNGASERDVTSIEVVLEALPGSTPPPAPVATPTPVAATLVPSGPAIYAYNASGFGGSGRLVSIDGSNPSVLVKNGNISCSGASAGQADWVVDDGNLDVSGSCNITGNVWVDKAFTLSGGTNVGGSVIASSITVSGSSKIGGSAWAAGNIALSGGGTEIGVNATAGGNLSIIGSAKLKRDGWVQGQTTLDWGTNVGRNLTTRTVVAPQNNPQQFVTGTITVTTPSAPAPSPYTTPARPIVADWVDFGYVPADWVGFTEVLPKPTGTCDYAKLTSIITSLAGKKGLVDLRGCANTISVSDWQKLTITNDLVLVANKFSLGGSSGFTSSADRRLWLINADSTKDGQPTCGANQSFQVGGSFTFDAKLDVMMYSPCHINISSGTKFTGQIFAGNVTVGGDATITYTAVGLPGVDLNTGLSTTNPTTNPTPAPTAPPATPTYPAESQRTTVVSNRIVEQGN
jgi:cytoskeletal protein CcmA (bactofilin family)